MKKQKHRIFIFFINIISVVLVFSVISCEKFLEENNTSDMTSDADLNSEEIGEALTVGCYEVLPYWIAGATNWGNYLPCAIEYLTGKAYTSDSHGYFWQFQTDQVAGSLLDDFNNYWSYQYEGIRACNLAIEELPDITAMTESERSVALGEVRTLRAFYYFNLVRYFGDVVMTTESVSDLDDVERPRTSLKTIYDDVIIPDLEFAVESDLEDEQSSGRVTKFVARTILADVYLTCAGYPYQEVATDTSKNWCTEGLWEMTEYPVNSSSAISFLEKAKEQLDVLYGQYTLGTYDDIHDQDMEFQGEAVFEASFLDGVNSSSGIVAASLPNGSRISYFGDEYGTYIPSTDYYNSYDPDDLRVQERQFFFTSDTKSDKYDETNPTVEFDMAYLYKFYDYEGIKTSADCGLDWYFYRYAEILLMLTEVNWALDQLGETVSDADIVKGINEVRERAELSDKNASTLTLNDIMSERAYELIFENKMLWDMRRTRTALIDGDGSFSIESFFGHRPSDFTYSFSAKHLLSPIGDEEIDENSLCEQNYDYLPTN